MRFLRAVGHLGHGLFSGPWERLTKGREHYAPDWSYWKHLKENLQAAWEYIRYGKLQ